MDDHYLNPKLAALYDLDSPWSADRDFYLSLAGPEPMAILDLGCGTGLLCNAYAAHGHKVTGVDPSAAMLAVARQKPHGDAITWVQTTAQAYRSEQLFDLVIMTGHAFQAILDDADIALVFQTIRRQLKPSGRAVFETRNPAIDWVSCWDYDLTLRLNSMAVRETRRFLRWQGDRMVFELSYAFPDESLVSQSTLRFLTEPEIKAHLDTQKLQASRIYGDWDRAGYSAAASPEMIFYVEHQCERF